jgi:hypothetical protein
MKYDWRVLRQRKAPERGGASASGRHFSRRRQLRQEMPRQLADGVAAASFCGLSTFPVDKCVSKCGVDHLSLPPVSLFCQRPVFDHNNLLN